jgi:hypothetical protein
LIEFEGLIELNGIMLEVDCDGIAIEADGFMECDEFLGFTPTENPVFFAWDVCLADVEREGSLVYLPVVYLFCISLASRVCFECRVRSVFIVF